MQARGRRRHRALFAREHRLIVGAVLLVGGAGGRRYKAATACRRARPKPGRAPRRGRQTTSVTSPPSPFASTVASSWSRKQTRPSLPKRTTSPTASRLPGFTKAFQREPSSRCTSVAAMAGSCSPRPMRRPCRLAAMTLVSLTTSASPARNNSGKSRMVRSSSAGDPPGRTTRSRAASRGEAGRNAMRSSGKSKSNRSVRIYSRM